MKTIFVHDEIIPGFNDACAPRREVVVPAGGQRQHRAAAAQLEKVCRDARIAAKLDRAAELMERITAVRNRPVPDAAGAGPSVWALMAGYQPSAGEMARRVSAEQQARICAESEAAYAARNPHKKGGTGA